MRWNTVAGSFNLSRLDASVDVVSHFYSIPFQPCTFFLLCPIPQPLDSVSWHSPSSPLSPKFCCILQRGVFLIQHMDGLKQDLRLRQLLSRGHPPTHYTPARRARILFQSHAALIPLSQGCRVSEKDQGWRGSCSGHCASCWPMDGLISLGLECGNVTYFPLGQPFCHAFHHVLRVGCHD